MDAGPGRAHGDHGGDPGVQPDGRARADVREQVGDEGREADEAVEREQPRKPARTGHPAITAAGTDR